MCILLLALSFLGNISGNDKKLFTPGPLLCSSTIKKAMQRDLGSRDVDFIQTVKDVRSELLKVAGEDSFLKTYYQFFILI